METLCFMNKMNPFHIHALKPVSMDTRILATEIMMSNSCQETERKLKSRSPLKRHLLPEVSQYSGVVPPVKQFRMDTSAAPQTKPLINVFKTEAGKCEIVPKECSPIKVEQPPAYEAPGCVAIQSKDDALPEGHIRHMDLKELCLRQMLRASVLRKTKMDLNQMLEESRQRLYRTIEDTFDSRDADEIKDNWVKKHDVAIKADRWSPTPSGFPTLHEQFARQLRGEATAESSRVAPPLYASINSPASGGHRVGDDACDDDDNDDDKNDDEDERGDDSDSRSSTPSSGFIDIEADTPPSSPPSSPLNLSTNNDESIPHDDGTSRSPHRFITNSNTRATDKDNLSCQASPEDLKVENLRRNVIRNTRSSEKKTNFSIDAILKPDFGTCSNVMSHNDSKTFLNCVTADREIPCPSSPSAFTAVDLSTKSRSESLSSPCSSSSSSSSRSSPSSPPMSSSSSPLSLKKNWDHGSEIYPEKPSRGNEHFYFAQRLFANPSKELGAFLGGQFPFVGPAMHGKVHFPHSFPPHHTPMTSPAFHGDVAHPMNYSFLPNVAASKAENPLQTDISKLVNWSVQTRFSSSPKHQQPSVVHKQTALPRQPSNNLSLKFVTSNENAKAYSESKSSQKHLKVKAQDATRPTQSSPSFQNSVNIPTKDQDKKKVQQKLDKNKDEISDQPAGKEKGHNPLWPAWVFCTRYSDRPSSGPRSRKPKRNKAQDEKRPRTAFTNEQLQRLKREFEDCRYLTETRRKNLAEELGLTESQIKIWFQNKRAKIKKSVGVRNPLALQLMEQGLYNHSTVKDFLDGEMSKETLSDSGEDSS